MSLLLCSLQHWNDLFSYFILSIRIQAPWRQEPRLMWVSLTHNRQSKNFNECTALHQLGLNHCCILKSLGGFLNPASQLITPESWGWIWVYPASGL
jgi:hypothetical protein